MRSPSTLAILAALLLTTAAAAAIPEHPYMLWTKDEVAAIKKRIETEDWAKKRAEEIRTSNERYGSILRNLFKIAVFNDKAAIESEKKTLLAWTNAPHPLGGANEFNVLRYDVLHPHLTAEERQKVQETFREFLDYSLWSNGVFDPKLFNNSANYSRYDKHEYSKSNWLPNIIFPRRISANMMVLALGDEDMIKRAFEAHGSMKYYMDDYLSDEGYYQEEFSKMGATPGAQLLLARALDRAGLNQYGWGYKGKHGATLKGHIYSLVKLTYPAIDLGTSRPQFARMTIGDLRGPHASFPHYAFQQHLVTGYLPDGTGGNELWRAHGAWGGTTRGNSPQWDNDKTDKMQTPYWFEIAHNQYPDAGFDYFLAQMRAPDENVYTPSLYWGIDPVDPAKVKAPPAPSTLAPQRGVALLRADESPAYWTSPAPAVGFRLTSPYAHDVNDPLAIAGFVAHNRPLYINRHINPSYASGWTRSVKSHAGIQVNDLEPRPTTDVTLRHAFLPALKTVGARSAKLFPDANIDTARTLLLTRDYLVDIARLAPAAGDHTFCWRVHALGHSTDAAWTPAASHPLEKELVNVRTKPIDNTWSVDIIQDAPPGLDPAKSRVGPAWYAKRIGVRIHMTDAPNTAAFLADTPKSHDREGNPNPVDESGGTTLVVQRKGSAATFIAVHEPLLNAQGPITAIRTLTNTDEAIALAIDLKPQGKDAPARHDLLLFSHTNTPTTLTLEGNTYTFTGQALIRTRGNAIEATSTLTAMQRNVEGTPTLTIDNKPATPQITNNTLTYPPSP